MTAAGAVLQAQDGQRPIFRVKVDMVVLSFQVTDSKGHYVNGLKPTDFRIFEDGILQQVATFAEGAKAPLAVGEDGSTRPLLEANKEALPGMERPDAFVGTNVFVLFDTSNFMYKGFVYAEDAIADFVRGLDRADSIAVYTFSRNLSRASALTRDHSNAIAGLRKSVAGDDTALYNALLLALRDAAKVPGRKVIIVFSNGPDNASMVAPDDVRAVAEDEGIPIYVISTAEVNQRSHFEQRLQAHLAAHRRQSLFRQDLAETGGGLRRYPRRPGQLLHRHVLSESQSQRRLPQNHHRPDQRSRQKVAYPQPSRLSSQPSPIAPVGQVDNLRTDWQSVPPPA